MEIRLKENPAFFICKGTAGVGTFDNKKWFICVLQPHNKNGISYPGYYAFWRFKHDYDSKELAMSACEIWLETALM